MTTELVSDECAQREASVGEGVRQPPVDLGVGRLRGGTPCLIVAVGDVARLCRLGGIDEEATQPRSGIDTQPSRQVEGVDILPSTIDIEALGAIDDIPIGQGLDTRADLRQGEV